MSAEAPGAGASASALLQDIILRHYRAPIGKRVIDHPTVTVERANPLCGDTLTLALRVRDGVIEDAGFQARACSITQATASMVMERVVGTRIEDGVHLADRIDALIEPDPDPSATAGPQAAATVPDAAGDDLLAVRSVIRFPARKACVRLVTTVLRDALSGVRDPRRAGHA